MILRRSLFFHLLPAPFSHLCPGPLLEFGYPDSSWDQSQTLLFYMFPEQLQPPAAAATKSLQSCPTLCDPIDGSPPGSSIRGIFQAGILEWGAIAFSDLSPKSLLICDDLFLSSIIFMLAMNGQFILQNDSIWISLMVSHSQIEVVHFWQAY